MPASYYSIILGALSYAISTQSIQLTDSPWFKCGRLQITPIFDGSNLRYLTLEFQPTSSTIAHQ
ncbi:hypothetical protein BDW68DRAFT_164066 [Aspergillus falconensis]